VNIDKLQRRLIAAARTEQPSDRVPFAFEKRVMAVLGTPPAADRWANWAGALWRAAGPCAATALVLALWTLIAPRSDATDLDLAAQFEELVLAEDSSPALLSETMAE